MARSKCVMDACPCVLRAAPLFSLAMVMWGCITHSVEAGSFFLFFAIVENVVSRYETTICVCHPDQSIFRDLVALEGIQGRTAVPQIFGTLAAPSYLEVTLCYYD